MAQSLLFIPDISGYTKFVQTTEIEHSQHVIAELLEVLIAANTQELKLAEIEGDALFFYKESSIPSQEKLLAQIETMFTAFYSHLKLIEKNRICPCNACATAPELQLKIIAHCGDLEFLEVQGSHKPFGGAVIQSHRVLKNSVPSDNYALITAALGKIIGLAPNYRSALFHFREGEDTYDEHSLSYSYSHIDIENLKLQVYERPKEVDLSSYQPSFVLEREFPVAANELLETITNYTYRYQWVNGIEEVTFAENEVTRIGSEHTCVIGGKHLNFVTVSKKSASGGDIYGELTTSPRPVDALYQFFHIEPLDDRQSLLKLEVYLLAKSPLKKLMLIAFAKKAMEQETVISLDLLHEFVRKKR